MGLKTDVSGCKVSPGRGSIVDGTRKGGSLMPDWEGELRDRRQQPFLLNVYILWSFAVEGNFHSEQKACRLDNDGRETKAADYGTQSSMLIVLTISRG
ncbi:hypothetical protein R1flu_001127 [Riccia fluitans]|uniref:Uncharacterized protein n=1 Tax=Riccia fluitans TaxID=41844 RepID=A0ABD1Y2F7_9MARC